MVYNVLQNGDSTAVTSVVFHKRQTQQQKGEARNGDGEKRRRSKQTTKLKPLEQQ
jgi:hypothetical protein